MATEAMRQPMGEQAPVQVCKQGRKLLEKVQGKKKKPDREARETCGMPHTLLHPVSPPPPTTLLTKLNSGSIHSLPNGSLGLLLCCSMMPRHLPPTVFQPLGHCPGHLHQATS